MKRQKVPKSAASAATLASNAALDQPEEIRSAEGSVAFSRFTFQSAEFNCLDDLDDNTGNYRTFQSLAGVVTADMRHHEERERLQSTVDEIDGGHQVEDTVSENSGNVALSEREYLPLTVISKGRILIIDTDIKRVADCGELLKEQGMPCTLCLPTGDGPGISQSRIGSLTLAKAGSVSVHGAFGGFTAMVPVTGGQMNLAELLGREPVSFDLVLDLQAVPSFAGKQLPIGYFAPGEDGARLDEALAELSAMKGRFKKPRFADFLEDRCLHGRSRSHDCSRCLQICPVAAIRSEHRKIFIDPYICQGCGSCALVCPADAIHLLNPPREELLTAIQDLLTDALAAGHAAPDLIVHDNALDRGALGTMTGGPAESRIFHQVDDISRIGLEMMLAALAYGAGRITLVCDRETPTAIQQALERQLALGASILRGLNLAEERIRFVVQTAARHDSGNRDFQKVTAAAPSFASVMPAATFAAACDKRTLTRLAVQHLAEVSAAEQSSLPLPEGAPFGGVAIDAASCTLCMACAGACPSAALSATGEVPRLSLVESRCHQCGLCVEACPEDAIKLMPRLLWAVAAADAPSVLREAEPFRCIECGEPFASQAMISRMQEKLTGHWMYSSDRQMSRLRMCRACRTRDALMAKDFR
jgi:ferredoxin